MYLWIFGMFLHRFEFVAIQRPNAMLCNMCFVSSWMCWAIQRKRIKCLLRRKHLFSRIYRAGREFLQSVDVDGIVSMLQALVVCSVYMLCVMWIVNGLEWNHNDVLCDRFFVFHFIVRLCEKGMRFIAFFFRELIYETPIESIRCFVVVRCFVCIGRPPARHYFHWRYSILLLYTKCLLFNSDLYSRFWLFSAIQDRITRLFCSIPENAIRDKEQFVFPCG